MPNHLCTVQQMTLLSIETMQDIGTEYRYMQCTCGERRCAMYQDERLVGVYDADGGDVRLDIAIA